jgi:uncharacterized membrane protein
MGHAMNGDQAIDKSGPSAAFWLMFLVAVAIVFYVGIRSGGFELPIERVPWSILVPCFALFSFAHSVVMLGWPRAATLLLLCLAISFTFEYVGASTGAIFGPYYYTDVLDPKLFGQVPVLIPFAWYMMFYPSHVITNILADGSPVSEHKNLVRIVWMSALGALVMTAWDLTMDPVMSFRGCEVQETDCLVGRLDESQVGHPAWVWEYPGPHFGVPMLNYRGWLLTSFLVFFLFRLIEPRIPHRPMPGAETRFMAFLAVGSYGAMAFIDAWIGYPEIDDIHLITPFAMGIPFLFATFRLFTHRSDLPRPSRDPRET